MLDEMDCPRCAPTADAFLRRSAHGAKLARHGVEPRAAGLPPDAAPDPHGGRHPRAGRAADPAAAGAHGGAGGAHDGGARRRPGGAPGETPVEEGVELAALGAADEADILAEIGAAYLARLGDRTHVPFTLASREAALRVPLDHWAGFVLSLIDGAASVEDLVDASALPEVEALRLLCELCDRGLIGVRPRAERR